MNKKVDYKKASSDADGEAVSRETLDSKFKDGMTPTGKDFADIFASTLNIVNDGVLPVNGEKGNIQLKDNDVNTLDLSPDSINSSSELNVSCDDGDLSLSANDFVVINKMKLGEASEDLYVDKIENEIKSSVNSLVTSLAISDYAAKKGGDAEIDFSVNKLDVNESGTISTKGDALEIKSLLCDLSLASPEGKVIINKLVIGDNDSVEINKIVNEIENENDNDTSLPTVSAVVDYISPYLCGLPDYYNNLVDVVKSSFFAGIEYLVTDNNVDAFKAIFGTGNVFDTINGALDKAKRDDSYGAIYVTSTDRYWYECITIERDANIIFASGLTLVQSIRNAGKKPLIKISGEDGNTISVEIKGDINGGNQSDLKGNTDWPSTNRSIVTIEAYISKMTDLIKEGGRAPGIFAEKANVKFTGNISCCCYSETDHYKVGAGGASFYNCPEVEIIGDVVHCLSSFCSPSEGGSAGVFVSKGRLSMTGNIKGCFSYGQKWMDCGGITLTSCSGRSLFFGNIIDCVAASETNIILGGGGGLALYNSNFEMNGDIIGCVAKSCIDSSMVCGGGAYIKNVNESVFINGNIVDCQAISDNATFGGGLYLGGGSAAVIGTISGCKSTGNNFSYGGGVYGQGTGKFTITGNVVNCEVREYGSAIALENGANCYAVGNIIDCVKGNGSGGPSFDSVIYSTNSLDGGGYPQTTNIVVISGNIVYGDKVCTNNGVDVNGVFDIGKGGSFYLNGNEINNP